MAQCLEPGDYKILRDYGFQGILFRIWEINKCPKKINPPQGGAVSICAAKSQSLSKKEQDGQRFSERILTVSFCQAL